MSEIGILHKRYGQTTINDEVKDDRLGDSSLTWMSSAVDLKTRQKRCEWLLIRGTSCGPWLVRAVFFVPVENKDKIKDVTILYQPLYYWVAMMMNSIAVFKNVSDVFKYCNYSTYYINIFGGRKKLL